MAVAGHPPWWPTKAQKERADKACELRHLEDRYTALCSQVGPLWGEAEEQELVTLAREIQATYDGLNVAPLDRIAL